MKIPIARLMKLLFFVAMEVQAQPGVWLKVAGKGMDGPVRASVESNKRRTAGRWHELFVFADTPGPAHSRKLNDRGITVLQYVPERGLMVSAPDDVDIEGVGVEWRGRLRADQKLSPNLPAEGKEWWTALVEFHSDVNRADAIGIVFTEELTVIDHPDLVATQVLVRGPLDRIHALARWDETAYVFPASREMESGGPLEACGGALTSSGPIGQIVARYGDGWDGPGAGAADVGFYYSSLTGRLTPEQIQGEFLRVFGEWSKHVKVRFVPSGGPRNTRTINILFGSGDHGDGFPFDGAGKTLAHTYYPSPPNPEPIAGDLHLDDDESWSAGGNVDLFSVALHEVGHALGLGHSDNPSAVMYPYYRKAAALTGEDIQAIRELYAGQDGSAAPSPTPLELLITQPAQASITTDAAHVGVGGTTSGGAAVIRVTWASSAGGSGVAEGYRPWAIPAVALNFGENLITITATDAARNRVSRQIRMVRQVIAPDAITLRILTPASTATYASSQPTIVLGGTASPIERIARIFWSSSRGSGGSVAGSPNWTTASIALETGENRITVTAVSSSGSVATAMLNVVYQPASPPTIPPGPDTAAPSLTILEPALTTMATSQPSIWISGTAIDNIRVSEVNWITSTGRAGVAAGTSNWRAEVPLQTGINTIVVRAWDGAANMSWRSLVVTRN